MAFGVSDAVFDTRIIPECYIVLRDIRKFPFGVQYEDVDALSAHLSLEYPVVICENDCLLVAAKSLLEGFDRLEVAEYSAKAILESRVLGPVKPIEGHEIDEINKVFLGKKG
jgi:L-fuculose-phosphate aldolase